MGRGSSKEFKRQTKYGEEESDAESKWSPSYTDMGSHTDTGPLVVTHGVTW